MRLGQARAAAGVDNKRCQGAYNPVEVAIGAVSGSESTQEEDRPWQSGYVL
jgi:hypothetical protein